MSVRTVDFSSTAYAKTKSFTAKESSSGAARVKEKRKDGNQLVKSSWTPAKADLNEKLFEERKELVSNWFDRWSNAQRKEVLEILFSKCKHSQLQYAFSLVDDKIPITHVDFTRRLPRVISVYIFSFLDPRSLCRCAQVCWFWKFLSELDQIWLPKCLKFGWLLTFVPSPYEHGVWKRHYLESVRGLQYLRPKSPLESTKMSKSDDNLGRRSQSMSNLSRKTRHMSSLKDQPMPWRGPDPRPVDTVHKYSVKDSPISSCRRCNRSSHKDNTESHIHGDHIPRKTSAKNTKPKIRPATTAFAPETEATGNKFDMRTGRPDWAVQSAVAPVSASRPPAPVVRPSAQSVGNSRGTRDPPVAQLFPTQPWRRAADYDSD